MVALYGVLNCQHCSLPLRLLLTFQVYAPRICP